MADTMDAITDIVNEMQIRQSELDGHVINSIAVDPKRAPLITWAFEQYATGDFSLTRLQQALADQGLTNRRTANSGPFWAIPTLSTW